MQDEEMNAMEVTNLTKLYGDFVAVDGLSFSLRQGEVLGLVGPNGAGKTTTLRAIVGIHPPTRGAVVVHGFNLETDPVEAKRHIGFVPDEPRLFEYLTVEEHLHFVSRIYGLADWRPAADELLRQLELDDRRRSVPGELSRGMKQKLMIACALIHQPELLVLDEPLTGLDPLGIRRMKDIILRCAQQGAAVILSSHLLHLVEEICKTVLIIDRGKKVAAGRIEDVKRESGIDSSLEEAFIRITTNGGE